MKKCIWINPVAEKMYGNKFDFIKNGLIDKDYKIANCDPQLEYVRNQYVKHSKYADKTILDCRCPEAIDLLKRNAMTDPFDTPNIEPILIRTSRVLYDKYIKEDDDILIITCPCTQLRDFAKGRLKDKKNLFFYTWKEFAESEEILSLGKIESSPIPLGFFRDSFENVIEISSEEEIIKEVGIIIEDPKSKVEVVEMLYCKDGCNNGDGL